MDAERRAEITGWDAREFSDGFEELGRLADRGFSGAVTNGTGWLFVFEGRVVGTTDADLDAFADASGTIYKAPEGVLPVLFAMQEQGEEPRAQYYTNDTPLTEADQKLSRGGFTGYVELSENVLSGDYYVTYTAGESMAAAYVGNSRRLETGDKAFELADDEVGIYTVYEVDLDVREVPDVGTADGAAPAVGEAAEGGDGESAAVETGDAESETEGDGTVKGEPEADGPGSDETGVSEGRPGQAGTDPATVEGSARSGDARPSPRERADASSASDEDPTGETRPAGKSTEEAGTERAASRSADDGGADGDDPLSPRSSADRADVRDASAAADTSESGRNHPEDDVFSEEEEWREQKSIPALDPSEASDPPSDRGRSERGTDATGRSSREETDRQRSGSTGRGSDPGSAATNGDDRSPEPRSTDRDRSSRANRSVVSQRASGTNASGRGGERAEQLRAELEAAEEKRASLAAERDELAAGRDELADERDELAAEVDSLESELTTLREERDRLESELAAARDRLPESDRTISPAEARSGTNLFVRYGSKGGATLEDAHDGTVDREALRENLRIEHHTSFETDGLAVDGRPFEEFLEETIAYGFTRWLVEDLPFEVRGTDNQSVLRDLYDAIPEIDRAEIGGSVSIAIRENGEETREQRSFDLVLRDRMGNPLFVADLNDSRDPTAEGTLESLVENGRDIAESNDALAAAFAVTESFFEPGALETAADAVGGGLFSRSKRASFVKLSRKQGYHLCLVEARDGGFHMTVPDL